MNHLNAFHRRKKRGSVLVIVIGIMVFIFALFSLVSSYQSQMFQNEEIKMAAKNESLVESEITQALRAATYLQYWNDIAGGSNPSGFAFSTTDFDGIITSAGALLGVANLATGANANVSMDSGGSLNFSITKPTSGFPYAMIASTITGTGGWLDGTPAFIASLPFTIAVKAKSIVGLGQQYYANPTRTILMCQINPSSIAAEAESDLQLNNAATLVSGTVGVAGTINGGAVNIVGNVGAGQVGTGSHITQGGTDLARGINGSNTAVNGAGFTIAGQTEIAEYGQANQVRQSNFQRMDTLVRPIPTNFLYREGLVGSSYITGDAATTTLYEKSQPYYSVPGGFRLYGNYSNAGLGNFTPMSGTVPNDNLTGLPTWCSSSSGVGDPWVVEPVAGSSKLVLFVDLQKAITAFEMAHPGEAVRIFVGGTDGTMPDNCFNNMIVALSPLPTLIDSTGTMQPPSVTIISPNTVVFRGNINTAPPLIPFTVIAQNTAFGINGGAGIASFVGQVQGNAQVNNTISLAGADGVATPGSVHLTSSALTGSAAAEVSAEAAGQSLYIALISQD